MCTKQFLIREVLDKITAAGFEAYFVGGCVRDELLNLTPKDFDITTNAMPEDLHKIFTKFSNVSKNSEAFGVTIILVANEDSFEEVEIATFRKDTSKGRHPEVSLHASIEEDAARRDFTVNALYQTASGKVLDPTGMGLEDVKYNELRFVGDPKERLSEDPLRAFRFVRFLAKGFSNPYSPDELLEFSDVLDFSGVSKERRLKEIKQIFGGKYFDFGSEAFIAASCLGIWKEIGLEKIFAEMENVKQSWRWHAEGGLFTAPEKLILASEIDQDISKTVPYKHGTVLDHTMLTLKAMRLLLTGTDATHRIPEELSKDFSDEVWLLTLGAILHDIGKAHCEYQGTKVNTFKFNGATISEVVPKVSDHPFVGVEYAEDFCKNLGMSNQDTEFVKELVREHMHAHELTKHSRFHDIFHFVKKPLYKEIMVLAYADELGSIKLEGHEERGSVPEMVKDERVVKAVAMEIPDPVLTGNDLIKFQRTPGPLFKKMLETAYNVQLDQNISDKDLLYKMVKNIELNDKGE